MRQKVKKSKDKRIEKGLIYLTGWISQDTHTWLQLTKVASNRTIGEIIDSLISCTKESKPFYIQPKPWPDYIVKSVQKKMAIDELTNLNRQDPDLLTHVAALKEKLGVKALRRKKVKAVAIDPAPKKKRGKKKFERSNPLMSIEYE